MKAKTSVSYTENAEKLILIHDLQVIKSILRGHERIAEAQLTHMKPFMNALCDIYHKMNHTETFTVSLTRTNH